MEDHCCLKLSGSTGHDYVVGQYLAEMTPEPIFMVRNQFTKYVLSDNDPPQCFDLKNDPDERVNLAAEMTTRSKATNVWSELRARFDIDTMGGSDSRKPASQTHGRTGAKQAGCGLGF